jgi:hypothetical protein
MTKRLSKSASRIILSVIILVAIVGATILFNSPTSPAENNSSEPTADGPTDECGPYQPTEQDIDRTFSLGKELFDSDDWEERYTVEPYRVTSIHQSVTSDIIALAETLIFTCGYGQEELNNLFGDNLGTMFSDYQSLNVSNFCEKPNEIALYELDLVLDEVGYAARLWVKQESDTRLMTMRLVFLQSDSARLEEYSQKIFPEFNDCP